MDCRALLPNSVPHATRLIRDFHGDFSKLSAFYGHPPDYSSILSVARQLQFPEDRRRAVASVLRDQNRHFGASAATDSNLSRFEQGAVAIVSGQQAGLLGGPAYTFYKAMSAIATARRLTSDGIPAVPVFWIATEDHDVDEVRHATWFRDGELRRFELEKPAGEARPVGRIVLGEGIRAIVDAAAADLQTLASGAEVSELLRGSYIPQATYGEAFARLLARIFREDGLILLDPLDPRFHRIAEPILVGALEHRDALNQELLNRGKELERAGYAAQVNVTSRSTLLFTMESGARKVISAVNGSFTDGQAPADRRAWRERIAAAPENFSPNALLRPVMQDYLLPTVAYFGGPAEVAYFAQSQVIYERLLGRMPVILPRADFTLVDPKAVRILKKYGLQVEDVWRGRQELQRRMYGVSLPKKLTRSFDGAVAQIEKSVARLHSSIAAVDPTVQGTIARSEKRIKYQLEKLRQKSAQALDRHEKLVAKHELFLESLLYPQKGLQSRDLCFLPFLARLGFPGMSDLETCAGTAAGRHLVVEIP